jgi:hypothetical protein
MVLGSAGGPPLNSFNPGGRSSDLKGQSLLSIEDHSVSRFNSNHFSSLQ